MIDFLIFQSLFKKQVGTSVSEEVTKVKGKVKWYNDMKSYGFIEVEDGKDVFVHRNALPEGTTLNEGDEVEFDVEETPKGLQAANVTKL